jgi:hypothetical protein
VKLNDQDWEGARDYALRLQEMQDRMSPLFLKVCEPAEKLFPKPAGQIATLYALALLRFSRAACNLMQGNGDAHGDFGDIIRVLDRPALEAVTNYFYVFEYLPEHPSIGFKDSKLIALNRLRDYWNFKNAKDFRVSANSHLMRRSLDSRGNVEERLEAHEASLEDYNRKYFSGKKPPPSNPWLENLGQRLKHISSLLEIEQDRNSLELSRCGIQSKNSWIHSDLHEFARLVELPEDEMRSSRLYHGFITQCQITGYVFMVFRHLAERVGMKEEFSELHLLEYERSAKFSEWYGKNGQPPSWRVPQRGR